MSTHRPNRKYPTAIAIAVGLAFSATAWAADPAPKEVLKDAKQTLEVLKKADPEITQTLSDAAAYAVFPSISKGAAVVGAAGGTGVLYEKGKPTGLVKMNQLSVGAQLGAQSYSEVLVLQDPQTLTNFKKGQFSLSAEASAVALQRGASRNAEYREGVKIFTFSQSGLMFDASVGGQRFKYTPLSDEKVSLLVP
jgi:lipid-binding SYLF domain-containing protein